VSVLRALGNGLESVVVKLGVGFGYRDEEQRLPQGSQKAANLIRQTACL
jgi:hypothetical protein